MDYEVIAINEAGDAAFAISLATQYAQEMGFNALACAEISLGVSEIVQNVIRYANSGKMEIFTKNANKILHLKITDEGKGIPDITLAQTDGYSSSKTSLGIGLGVAQRAFDYFDIQSEIGKGTSIHAKKILPMPAGKITWGIASMKDERYDYNGDVVYTKEYDGDKLLLAVIDGLGQGHSAYQMAMQVQQIIENNYTATLEKIISLCHQDLLKNEEDSSVAIALLRIVPEAIHYLGIGDTHTYLRKEKVIQELFNHDGRVGIYTLPSLTVKVYPAAAPYQLLVCSDGINTRLRDKLPDFNNSAQHTANYIFNTYHRLHGDATVLVVNYNEMEKE